MPDFIYTTSPKKRPTSAPLVEAPTTTTTPTPEPGEATTTADETTAPSEE